MISEVEEGLGLLYNSRLEGLTLTKDFGVAEAKKRHDWHLFNHKWCRYGEHGFVH